MIFTPTALPGAWMIDPERREDDRGFFARTWCEEEFEAHGLNPHIAQCSISFNGRQGTLRGMHYQAAPYAEAKLVRCTMGAIFDVVVDLRPDSPTYCGWVGIELTSLNRRGFYIPAGVAHGFMTLSANAEVEYQISRAYVPSAARGVRWNDPTFGITWPQAPTVVAPRDQAFADYRP